MISAKDFLKLHRVYEDNIIYNSVDEIVGTISQIMEEYAQQLSKEEAETKEVRRDWISVNDRLPEDGSDVLAIIYDHGKFYVPFSCDFNNGLFYNETDKDAGISQYSDRVSHWMPLPPPPSK